MESVWREEFEEAAGTIDEPRYVRSIPRVREAVVEEKAYKEKELMPRESRDNLACSKATAFTVKRFHNDLIQYYFCQQKHFESTRIND